MEIRPSVLDPEPARRTMGGIFVWGQMQNPQRQGQGQRIQLPGGVQGFDGGYPLPVQREAAAGAATVDGGLLGE